jgi:mycothiol synthase
MRPVNTNDGPALLELFHRAERVELGEPYSGAADIDGLLGTPGLDLATHSVALIDDDGRFDGFAAVHPAPNQNAVRAVLVVGPERPTETANVLLNRIEEWADPSAPELNMYQYPGALAGPALTARGWRIAHSNTRLVIDLAAPAVPNTPHPRVRVRVAAGDAQRRVAHAILEDAVAGDWNHLRHDYAAFSATQQARPGYDPELWFIAELDGEPAGALIARDPAKGPWVAWLGVAETARGNGLAKNLLLTAFGTFRARGRHTVGVDTDTHNATGSVRVYERVGMVSQGTADAWARSINVSSVL